MWKRKFELQLVAPALILGLASALASACATSAASFAAEQVSLGMEDASAYVELLPSSEPTDCATCEERRSAAPARSDSSSAPSSSGASLSTQGSANNLAQIPLPATHAPSKSVHVEEENEDSLAEVKQPPEEKEATFFSAPRNAPLCPGISAYIITVFEDPRYSIATLSSDPRTQGTRRRVGQHYGDYRVVEIAFNRRHMSSAVWLMRGEDVCQVQLREEHPRRERVQRAAVRRYQREVEAKRKREEAKRKREEAKRKREEAKRKRKRKEAKRKRARAKRKRLRRRRARRK